jgi:hypothetical protein
VKVKKIFDIDDCRIVISSFGDIEGIGSVIDVFLRCRRSGDDVSSIKDVRF